ncbi:MAG: enoyl-CoA hydratase/isomerase family protein [Novosphingobium sp.]
MQHHREDRVLIEADGAVRIISLNRPEKLNAADLTLQQQLLARLQAVAADREVRAVIITGAGRAFSAGGDRSLAEAAAQGRMPHQAELSGIQVETNRCLLSLDVPVIAAVRGAAVGFGAGLVAMCDRVVMSEDAFLSDPHVHYGLPPSPATEVIWPMLTSPAIAKELLMTGRRIPAKEAVAIGLASCLCPIGEELATAREIAAGYLDLPPAGVAAAKRSVNGPILERILAISAAAEAKS